MTDDYENMPERELAVRALENDENAFGEIIRRFSPRVFSIAAGFFRQYSLIEEAAQEIFLKSFVQIKNFEGRGSMEGWMTRIAVTTCLNLLRTAKREPALIFSDLNDDENFRLEETIVNLSVKDYRSEENKLIASDLIRRLMRTLSAEEVLILTLIDGEGESVKTIAEITGWSESNVKVKAFRARKRIRESMQRLLKNNKERIL